MISACRCCFVIAAKSIPSFALEAVLLWLRITPAEVKIELPSRIVICRATRKFQFSANGTLLINPMAAKNARAALR